ncbi:aminoglycoside phosphotransferase family protein [Tenggerimyces flavus]|uniref:Aminoglycoside phosphotransferase family protein n=1 Tax=Tenggerimyces flavus TaxID=1708749 RepID=A0ABV7YK51_9ACTN|nr:aminoglycoside phosphotransferase family protein [Tenggerimyces flavus]MBM7784145.1 streptomycin 6-kinase [Tenggerimyces flavus]
MSAVEELCALWGLELDPGQRAFGDWNLVLLAHRGSEPCVLRVSGPEVNAVEEVTALRAWNGRGAVRVLEARSDAMLLERLDPHRSLRTVKLPDALEIAGDLIRTLSVPAPPGLPLLVDIAREYAEGLDAWQLAQGSPVPPAWLDRARTLAIELTSDPGTDLVHGDLHFDNILAGTRSPWLAIDPKPFVGHPERSVAELMWTRLDEVTDVHGTLAAVVRAGGLDADRALAWTIVQTTHYWLWALGAGLTEDPVRCHRLLEALLGTGGDR